MLCGYIHPNLALHVVQNKNVSRFQGQNIHFKVRSYPPHILPGVCRLHNILVNHITDKVSGNLT